MRKPRKQSETDIYHVINRGVGRQDIFETDKDRLELLTRFAKETRANDVAIFAWCFMTNHVHFLLKGEITDISKTMKDVCGGYSQWFNKKYDRTGHLFQERFKSEPVEREGYLIAAVRYIHANPEKAGLAPLEDYRWSSYQEYLNRPVITDTGYMLPFFGGLDGFREFHGGQGTEQFIDLEEARTKTTCIQDGKARLIAKEAMDGISLETLRTMPKCERNAAIVALRAAGLSIRQIERLTGISRGIIGYLEGKHDK